MTTTEADPPPESGRPAGRRDTAEGTAPEPVDENIWLEEIYGEEQLAWVREQNARTEELLEDAEYTALEGSILEVLDSTDRIAMVGKHGDWYYNFWKDRDNPKGLWRRTSWDSYRSGAPEWDVLLDVDALAAAEGEEWVFHGANFLRPAAGEPHRRALLALSPDGGDANRYREFDVESRSFVDPAAGGFDLPTAKGNASWLDADTLLVATTAEGLPADHVLLRPDRRQAAPRRDPWPTAERLFEIPEDHMMAIVAHDSTPGFERTFAVDWISFFERNTSVLRDGRVGAVDVPADVNLSSHREWLLFRPQKRLDSRRHHLPGGFPARRRLRGLPRRQPGPGRAVHPGRAHVPAVLELDAGLPAAEPAPRRVLGNPGPGSAAARDGLRPGRPPCWTPARRCTTSTPSPWTTRTTPAARTTTVPTAPQRWPRGRPPARGTTSGSWPPASPRPAP